MRDVPNYAIDERRIVGLNEKEMHEMEISRAESDVYEHMSKKINEVNEKLNKEQTLNKKLINISEEIIEEFIKNQGVITVDKIINLRDIIANEKGASYEY
jgi:hypothetical protein